MTVASREGGTESGLQIRSGSAPLTRAWNQQFFGDVENDHGHDRTQDAWRVDVAVGCRLTRHVQTKLQYSYTHQHGVCSKANS